jgi:CCR4-NOT transcription complex subunit 1
MGPPLAAKYKLAGAMRELGYSCSATSDGFKALLQQFQQRLDEQSIADVLGLLASTHKGLEPDGLGLADAMRAVLAASGASHNSSNNSATTWNTAVIMDGIKAAVPNISWQRVAECLDSESFRIPDAAGFSILMSAWRRATSEPFPLAAIAGRMWGNAPGQLSLLAQAVSAPPDVLSWERSSKKIQPLEGMGQGKSPLGTPNQAWASLDLLTVLAQLAELPVLSAAVIDILRRGPAGSCPEVLAASMAALRGPNDINWGILERFVWGSITAPLIFEGAGSSSRNVLLQRLWQQRPVALLQCMAEYLADRPGRAGDVLDVVLEVKGLTAALDMAPPGLSVELAAVAAHRKLLDLDKWLTGRLSRDANSGMFMAATLSYLEAQLSGIAEGRLVGAAAAGGKASGSGSGQGVSALSADSTTIFLRGLYTAGASVVPGLAAQLVRCLEFAKKAFPAAEAALSAAAASQLGSGAADSGLAAVGGAFPEVIELEANSYFQKLYHERQPVDELVAQLKSFKVGTPHQQVVFACMVHNLFDEYRFFPNYPGESRAGQHQAGGASCMCVGIFTPAGFGGAAGGCAGGA